VVKEGYLHCKVDRIWLFSPLFQERVLHTKVHPGDSYFAGEPARHPGEDSSWWHPSRGAAHVVQRFGEHDATGSGTCLWNSLRRMITCGPDRAVQWSQLLEWWDVTLCRWANRFGRFGKNSVFVLRVRQAKENSHSTAGPLTIKALWFLETPKATRLITKRYFPEHFKLQLHRCDNLKPHTYISAPREWYRLRRRAGRATAEMPVNNTYRLTKLTNWLNPHSSLLLDNLVVIRLSLTFPPFRTAKVYCSPPLEHIQIQMNPVRIPALCSL